MIYNEQDGLQGESQGGETREWIIIAMGIEFDGVLTHKCFSVIWFNYDRHTQGNLLNLILKPN